MMWIIVFSPKAPNHITKTDWSVTNEYLTTVATVNHKLEQLFPFCLNYFPTPCYSSNET